MKHINYHDIDTAQHEISARAVLNKLVESVLFKNKKDLGKILTLTIMTAGLDAALPYLINDVATMFSEDEPELQALSKAIAAIVLSKTLPILRNIQNTDVVVRSGVNLLEEIGNAILNNRDLAYHTNVKAADKEILFNKSLSIPSMLLPLLTQMLPDIIAYSAMLVGIKRQFGAGAAISSLAPLLTSISLAYLYSDKAQQKRVAHLNQGRISYEVFRRTVTQFKSIHDNDQAGAMIKLLEESGQQMAKLGRASEIFGLYMSLANLAAISVWILTVAGMLYLTEGGIRSLLSSQQDVIVFLTYFAMMYSLVPSIGCSITNILSAYPNVEEVIKEVLVSPAQQVKNYDTQLQSLNAAPEIKFLNVQAPFTLATKQSMKSTIDFMVDSKAKLALVGPSGAGKSTIFNLLSAYYSAESGFITINNIDIADIKPMQLRKNISVVAQQPKLISAKAGDATIRDCILFYIQDAVSNMEQYATDNAILTVADDLGLRNFLESLGLDKIVGEDGNSLSGGERQKVAIIGGVAKCLLGDEPAGILLLDECTSALDTKSADAVLTAISKLEVTVLAITHKLNEVEKYFDGAIVLKDGGVVAQGTHAELMEVGSGCALYQELYHQKDNEAVANSGEAFVNPGRVSAGFYSSSSGSQAAKANADNNDIQSKSLGDAVFTKSLNN